jgi:hypothetical protein
VSSNASMTSSSSLRSSAHRLHLDHSGLFFRLSNDWLLFYNYFFFLAFADSSSAFHSTSCNIVDITIQTTKNVHYIATTQTHSASSSRSTSPTPRRRHSTSMSTDSTMLDQQCDAVLSEDVGKAVDGIAPKGTLVAIAQYVVLFCLLVVVVEELIEICFLKIVVGNRVDVDTCNDVSRTATFHYS